MVQPQSDLELRDLVLARRALRLSPLDLADARLGRRQLAAGLRHRQLRLPQRPRRAVVPVARPRERVLREPLGRHRCGELPRPPLVHGQRLLGELGFLDQDLRPLRPLGEFRRLERHRLELRELGPDRVVSLRVVAGRPRANQPVEHPGPGLEATTLRGRAVALLALGAQLAGALARPAAFDQQCFACRLRGGHRLGRLGQLLEALPEILAVVHDRLHLAVEDAQHLRVLAAERSPARRARPFGPEPLDLVPLLLDFVVLLQQVGAARVGVFLFPDPHGALLLGVPLGGLEPLGECLRLALHSDERLQRRCQLRDAAVQRCHRPHQLRQLPLVRPTGGLLFL